MIDTWNPPTGKELNIAVAERILGYQRWTNARLGFTEAELYPPHFDEPRLEEVTGDTAWRKCDQDTSLALYGDSLVPDYLADTKYARRIIKALHKRGLAIGITEYPDDTTEVEVIHINEQGEWEEVWTVTADGENSMPLAVCQCALIAVGIKEGFAR